MMVTRFGSPPKLAMFARTHSSARIWSNSAGVATQSWPSERKSKYPSTPRRKFTET